MLAERGVVLADPDHGLPDRAGDRASRAFRRGAGAAIAAAQSDRAGELALEKVAFGFRLRAAVDVTELPRLLDVLLDLCQSPAVGFFRARVEQCSGISGVRAAIKDA